mmetsp:Transcript_92014/g.297710  ORF Transcript_92014/g.297710 Transcript_92014/m.297710 type:complete len:297 (+) Transcript_92014:11-901(+)
MRAVLEVDASGGSRCSVAMAASLAWPLLLVGLAEAGPRCADLVVTYDVYGAPGKGIDVERFTHGTMKWIGCGAAPNTCSPDTFFCDDLATGVRFGTTAPPDDSHAMRAQLGAEIPAEFTDCEPWQPSGMVNAPDKQEDVESLCQQMGFKRGALEDAPLVNWCPDARWRADKQAWARGSISAGFGRVFRCDDADIVSRRGNVTGPAEAVGSMEAEAPKDRIPGGGRSGGASTVGKWAAGQPLEQTATYISRLSPLGLAVLAAVVVASVASRLWGRRLLVEEEDFALLSTEERLEEEQ